MSSEDNEFSIIEKRDEAQILAELEGQVIEEYFYVTSKKKTVISYTGIKEIARIRGNIDTKLIEIRETEHSWLVVIKATDLEINNGLLGTSTQKKLEKVYEYEYINNRSVRKKDDNGKAIYSMEPDEFSYQKAFSKAQRNAIKSIIPEAVFAKALDEWRKNKETGKKTTTKRQAPRQVPAEDVRIGDFMTIAEIRNPETPLIDELARFAENWGKAVTITKDWMMLANINPNDFLIASDHVKLTVVPKKMVPPDMKLKLGDVMTKGGFLQAKIRDVDGWRLNRKEVTG